MRRKDREGRFTIERGIDGSERMIMPSKRRKAERRCIMFIRNVPEELKNQFKARCARRGVQMNERIIQLITAEVEREKEILKQE